MKEISLSLFIKVCFVLCLINTLLCLGGPITRRMSEGLLGVIAISASVGLISGICVAWTSFGLMDFFSDVIGWDSLVQQFEFLEKDAKYRRISQSIDSFERRLSISVVVMLDIIAVSLFSWWNGFHLFISSIWSRF